MKRGANSLLRNQIWPKLYIIKADVYILATNKFEQNQTISYEGGSESSVIHVGVITLLIYMIDCCIIP